ncbi:MAG: radical SAM family heme chaperone HemW [Chlamydiia bacterium]|nr:radical SAM family heme chaperone HemW [Chlamydiia bacterium]
MVSSVYFHIPFCKKKCPYCHFYVVPKKEEAPFLEALCKEWELRAPFLEGREIVSVYFGGGTPTLFPEGIEKILTLTGAKEVTVEANPEEVTPQLMSRLYNAGVNRVSIGVQSLSNPLLKVLGRSHTAQEAIDAVHTTRKAGIENITIDLMYELPHQTIESWEETVKQAVDLPITHLSLYNLTIESHTLFHKKEKELSPHLPSDDACAEMLKRACDHFEGAGLHRYEISAFARPGYESVHNSGYWTGREFLGFGPSAFSFWEGSRFQNICHLRKYVKKLKKGELPVDFSEKLSPLRLLHEQLAIGLRLTKGIPLPALPPFSQKLLSRLEREGWLTRTKERITLTPKGQLFYDTVAIELILDESAPSL